MLAEREARQTRERLVRNHARGDAEGVRDHDGQRKGEPDQGEIVAPLPHGGGNGRSLNEERRRSHDKLSCRSACCPRRKAQAPAAEPP
jgi:hypothetical protein